jgi:nucleoside-diphosphate-sugar epimerase
VAQTVKALVTGAAGFIGYHMSKLLLTRGDEVVGLDNLNDYYDPALWQARPEQLRRFGNFRFALLAARRPSGFCQNSPAICKTRGPMSRRLRRMSATDPKPRWRRV